MSNNRSTYYPSMYEAMREHARAVTAGPRRKLRKLLVLSMLMTLSMAVLSLHAMRILNYFGWMAPPKGHDDLTKTFLEQLATQFTAAGLFNGTMPLTLPPPPPQDCYWNPSLCHLSLPWLYGSVISLTCALGTLQTISRVRKDSQEHTREMRAIHVGLGSAGMLFCFGFFEFFFL
ncbi:hypothetical protein BC834DRAFT_132844 [Gloeopeniophorella convolvens]|nr:hypothetical protein BC834DRAFT_132844 [Gloeopeniophorella convolvens]